MNADLPPTLRARKKAETWSAIHEAAAALAVRHGVEGTTVEAVAAAAGVSPRTFFNYFPAKEDAVLGMRAPSLDPELLDGFSLEHDLLGQVSRLLLAVSRSAYAGRDAERRRRLLQDHPSLGRRRHELMLEAEALVRHTLAELLARDPAWSAGIGEHRVDEVARMLVLLGGVPLRFAITADSYSPAHGLPTEDHESALSLLHRLQEKLS
ncbi:MULTISPECIES: TetR family transcriptional regulator [Kocuria]|uniref:TetR family transcriptional regulator n=1 Tax=Kocuria TaxID=57493 RepID=UPI000366CE2A|nr:MULTISPECIES: TetR family transcriptional regulator [Kocuria]EYT55688.1 TetR family transcriptional regulator [Kocuria sp. UCD-OTCP]MEB2528559.1 TetR family transcriptional regulator [Kocuria rosea]MEB2618121.1 TetR family transcriptional regulator [Kocuria rosea]